MLELNDRVGVMSTVGLGRTNAPLQTRHAKRALEYEDTSLVVAKYKSICQISATGYRAQISETLKSRALTPYT